MNLRTLLILMVFFLLTQKPLPQDFLFQAIKVSLEDRTLPLVEPLDVIVKKPDDLEKILKELKSIQDDYRAKLDGLAK